MFLWNKNAIRIFAPVSLGFVLTSAFALAANAGANSAEPTASVKRQSASAQFARAEEQRAALNSKPSEKRTLAEYKQAVMSYRRVALITPRAPEVPDSLLAVAELYTEMGDRFGRSYYQSAVDSYEFLVRGYPQHKYCQEALLRIAKLQRDQLAEAAQAQKAYEEFLKRYPRSPRKREVEEALAELALLQNSEQALAKSNAREDAAPARTAAWEEARLSAPVHSGGKSVAAANSAETPHVRRIRASLNGDTTRVTIDLESSVEFTSGRIANPERIFFDLHAARLAPELARSTIRVVGGLLTAVRVAQNQAGVVRVALDVNGVKDYTAALSNNPPQLVIELYGNSFGAEPVRTASAKRAERTPPEDSRPTETAANNGARDAQTVAAKSPNEEVARPSEPPPAANSKSVVTGALDSTSTGTNATPSPRNTLPSAKNSRSKSFKAADSKPDLVRPASAPQPTRDGQSTLTRTLGLKIF